MHVQVIKCLMNVKYYYKMYHTDRSEESRVVREALKWFSAAIFQKKKSF